jgi:hypothetical protein
VVVVEKRDEHRGNEWGEREGGVNRTCELASGGGGTRKLNELKRVDKDEVD